MSTPARATLLYAALSFLACANNGGENLNVLTPRLAADPARVAFPEGELGQMVSAGLSLTNSGGGVTHFSARVEPESSGFAVDDARGQATSAQAGQVVLWYVGLAPGSTTATLVVEHDGAPGADGSRVLRVAILAVTRGPPDCNDHNPCTLDRVDPSLPGACLHEPTVGTCDDGNACTSADHCDQGTCVGTAVSCHDGVDCTVDQCNPAVGCEYLPRAAACDDGDPCTVDACEPTSASHGCTHDVAPNGTQCGAVACDNVAMCVGGQCVTLATPEGYPCDDGDPCTQGDACHAGACVSSEGGPTTLGAPVVISDPVPIFAGNAAPRFSTEGGQVAGHWPVALDGLITVPVYSGVVGTAAPQAMLLWRGVTDPSGSTCSQNPSSCTETDGCAPNALRAAMGTHLLLTRASADGLAISSSLLDLDSAYRMVATSQGLDFPAERLVPHSTVLNAAAVNVGGRLVGAALVHFADGCESCLQHVPSPTPTSGTALPACMSAGDAMLLFEASQDALRVVSTKWLGGSPCLS